MMEVEAMKMIPVRTETRDAPACRTPTLDLGSPQAALEHSWGQRTSSELSRETTPGAVCAAVFSGGRVAVQPRREAMAALDGDGDVGRLPA